MRGYSDIPSDIRGGASYSSEEGQAFWRCSQRVSEQCNACGMSASLRRHRAIDHGRSGDCGSISPFLAMREELSGVVMIISPIPAVEFLVQLSWPAKMIPGTLLWRSRCLSQRHGIRMAQVPSLGLGVVCFIVLTAAFFRSSERVRHVSRGSHHGYQKPVRPSRKISLEIWLNCEIDTLLGRPSYLPSTRTSTNTL